MPYKRFSEIAGVLQGVEQAMQAGCSRLQWLCGRRGWELRLVLFAVSLTGLQVSVGTGHPHAALT